MLANLESEDIIGTETVEVIARVTSVMKNHGTLEKIANKIGLESGINSVGWEVES
ncbi:hypothetical protein [Natronincola ferrireducens]|uniref:Putative Mg2+ transporter-C (MgtC) family protein n=1 Tax=Natronincola ferrireducens TaxID=393762 RepID=A0A1G8ZCA2_9FIRM|nr:hypothetical protein [Natronincola ferrireducens]SDK12638.1 putative Mg2+ transporter-C (MgtC) family protein [Natronincola ferrireducens]